MIRVIYFNENSKGDIKTVVLKYIDTATGIVEHIDYTKGNETPEIIELLDNLNTNGLLENYSSYFPDNPKTLKHLRQ